MYVLFDFSPEFRRQKEEKNLNRKLLFSVNLKFMEKTIFDSWREIGEKEGRDRKGREGRRHQGGQRKRGHTGRFLVWEEWENQLVPRLLRN